MTHTRFLPRIASLLSITGMLLAGCLPEAAGPSGIAVWIESPQPGRTLANETVIFTIYATDADGVSGISLSVNGAALATGAPITLSTDGSRRMARLEHAWQPPAPGTYVLTAQATGASGAASSAVSVTFCVEVCQEVGGQASTGTFPTPAVRFWAAPESIRAGECAVLSWETSDSSNVLLDGSRQPASGSQRNCLCETQSFTLTVTDQGGGSQEYPLTVQVSGSCHSPATETPAPLPVTLPPTPEPDTAGPEILSVSYFWEGCLVYGQAQLADPSGVSWAEFWFNHNEAGWAWIQMTDLGSAWQSVVGFSGGPTGSFEYRVRALDSLNNESWSGTFSHNYAYCGE